MRIDPHVHCRDWKQSYKATIKDVVSLAKASGVDIVFDMPNTEPPIISRELVERRLRTAEEYGIKNGYYLYVGVTKDPKQIEEAVDLVTNHDRVIGMKMYAGRSVGDISVINGKDQAIVYRTLADAGYKGVVAVHCEKEGLFRNGLWDPAKPETWNYARSNAAEVESVRDQIKFAQEAGFKGTVHVCHISTPEAVELVDAARKNIRITCGVTPHHLLYSEYDAMKNGLMFKVNPPIRDAKTRDGLMLALRQGKIDWIETDHAPHTADEKLNSPYMSGIQSLNLYAALLGRLRTGGFTEKQLDDLTFGNIARVFGKVRVS
ncbi:MAG: dihydroorotase [Candidatus Aenigmarchaeota archaeon]|nr:dihydroorotase [Candidatus Aenigmarchaeota archaeon]